MKKVLYIVPHRMNRSPGQRFRCEQYIPEFEKSGYKITYSNIISASDDKIFYSEGKYFRKFLILLKSIFIRIYDFFRVPSYDMVFIYREALMLGITLFERTIRIWKVPVVFDFDDAIWLADTSLGNARLEWLKKPSKTKTIIRMADRVFAGNKFLADYAYQYNKNVDIIPTTIDLQYHFKRDIKKENTGVCIGWTGTSTTLKHFETVLPVLEELYRKFGNLIYFKVIVNCEYEVRHLNLKATPWSASTEIEDLSEIDIGIMPLPNDEWSKGKCGFKGLQYMALRIPTIMSPVGVNNEIITNGDNGFLASGQEDWFAKLCQLIENENLRKKIGNTGYQTIASEYSKAAWKEKYINLLEKTMRKKSN